MPSKSTISEEQAFPVIKGAFYNLKYITSNVGLEDDVFFRFEIGDILGDTTNLEGRIEKSTKGHVLH